MITGIPTGDGDVITTTDIEESQESDTNISGSNTESNSQSFDTTTQELSTRTFGSTGSTSTDEEVTVTTSGDSQDSSPSGGSGLDSAASEFTGIEEDRLEGATDEAVVDVSNQASDVITNVARASERDPSEITTIPDAQEAVEEMRNATSNITQNVGIPDMPSLPENMTTGELTENVSDSLPLKIVSLIGGIAAFLAFMAALLRGN